MGGEWGLRVVVVKGRGRGTDRFSEAVGRVWAGSVVFIS